MTTSKHSGYYRLFSAGAAQVIIKKDTGRRGLDGQR
jgi:hypothetical protein